MVHKPAQGLRTVTRARTRTHTRARLANQWIEVPNQRCSSTMIMAPVTEQRLAKQTCLETKGCVALYDHKCDGEGLFTFCLGDKFIDETSGCIHVPAACLWRQFATGITSMGSGTLRPCKVGMQMDAGEVCGAKCDESLGYESGYRTYTCRADGSFIDPSPCTLIPRSTTNKTITDNVTTITTAITTATSTSTIVTTSKSTQSATIPAQTTTEITTAKKLWSTTASMDF